MDQFIQTVFKHQVVKTRYWIILGHLFFAGLLFLSLIYYQERVLALDSAYYTFKMITSGGFYTGHGRYVSYLPQLLPLLVLKAGGSLKAVLVAYSAGFVLFYYAVYNIIVYLFRNPAAGIFLALAMCLTIRYKFYGPVGESILSITYLALLLGWLSKPKEAFNKLPVWADILMGCSIGLLMYTAHPVIAVATLLALGFMLFYQWKWMDLAFWITGIFTALVMYYRFVFLSRNTYEQARVSRLQDTLAVLDNFQDYHAYDMIVRYFDTQYTIPFFVFILSLILLAKHRHWLLSLYVFGSALLMLILVFVAHAYLTSDIYIMIDGYLTYLGLIWALPLAFLWVKLNRSWMLLTIAMLMMYSLARIQTKHAFFTERLVYLENAIDQHTSPEHPKGVTYLTDMNYEKLWIGWALACETLMLSSLEGPHDSRSIYLADKPGDLDGRWEEEGLFLSVPFGPENVKLKDLPKRFFDLSAVPYREVKLD